MNPLGFNFKLRGWLVVLISEEAGSLHASFDRSVDLHTKLTLLGYDAGVTQIDPARGAKISSWNELVRLIVRVPSMMRPFIIRSLMLLLIRQYLEKPPALRHFQLVKDRCQRVK